MSLDLGARGDLVVVIQKKLKELRAYSGSITGIYDEKTKTAVAKFQKSKRLKTDGVADEKTIKALGIEIKTARFKLEEARESYKLLRLSNPNYFGNLVKSKYKFEQPIVCNTHYEKMICLGYHPQQKQLEAVIHVYQPSGYGSGICGDGTPEYVRFYLSFDDGVTWQDQGMSSFQAYNIPEGTTGKNQLEYAVSLPIDPKAPYCWENLLIKARAILSWNDEPEPDDPDWTPVWGNVLENTILVEPRSGILGKDFLEYVKPDFKQLIEKQIDPEAEFPLLKKPLSLSELFIQKHYVNEPLDRTAHKELAALAKWKWSLPTLSKTVFPQNLKINEALIKKLLLKKDGDTSYEELTCVGLDPNNPNCLVGVIHVKRPCGYSGTPCDEGSTEYVTFWGDFDGSSSFATCLGTAGVVVYDVASIPEEGIHYAVRLPVDLGEYRKACKMGPVLVRIRAILSWNEEPPTTEPDWVPRWGNREETLINIGPPQFEAGKIAILGGIPVKHIDDSTGLTTEEAIYADNNLPPDPYGRPSPFAGRVTVQGIPLLGWSYKVEVSTYGVPWTPVIKKLKVTDEDGNTTDHEVIATTNRFAYLPFEQNVANLLAEWDTYGDDLWSVRLTVFDGSGTQQGQNIYHIRLHNTKPTCSIDITTGTGNCGKFSKGTNLEGKFVANDGDYLREYNLFVHPNVNAPGADIPVPHSGQDSTTTAPGYDWSLDTSSMVTCGYTIHVQAISRAIRNSAGVGPWVGDSAGFCLEEPE